MNQHLPDPIRNLSILFRELPGVGPKTALRFVFALLKSPKITSERLAHALLTIHNQIKTCENCGCFTMQSTCSICKNNNRDKSLLCVVAESRDIASIEATGEFNGYYFVLGGLLSPIEGVTPGTLRINELLGRVRIENEIKEIILAFSPDLKGESTTLYLSKYLQNFSVRITKLGRGLPLGADLEYADEVTLSDALKGRKEIEAPKVAANNQIL